MGDLKVEVKGPTVKTKLTGDFGVDEAMLIREEVMPYTEDGFNTFVLDCKNLNFIDSSGIGILVAIYKRVKESKGEVIIKGINNNVKELFELTRLNKIFTIED